MEDNNKLFKEAAAESIRSLIIKQESVVKQSDDTQIEKAKEIVETELYGWSKLRAKMDGEYAERFMEELDNLSGREFTRNYLKALEYVKPKITRQELIDGSQENNNELIVVIKRNNDIEDTEYENI